MSRLIAYLLIIIFMDQAILKTSVFVPYPEKRWDQAYGSLIAYHCEVLHPISNEGASTFDPTMKFFNPEWQKNLDKISVIITPRHALTCRLRPQDGLEKISDFAFITHTRGDDKSIIEYALDIEFIENMRGLSLEKRPVHVFNMEISNSSQVDKAFWLDCEKAEFANGKAINNFTFETEYKAAIHVGRILGVESYSIDEYEALTGTDALLTYLQDVEDGFDLPGYIERRYEGMRVNYML